MINIRNNVFETNSSSTNSVTLTIKFKGLMETIVPDKNGIILFEGTDFSSNCYLASAIRKATCFAVFVHFMPHFKDMFEDIIKKHTGAKEIQYNINIIGADINSFMCKDIIDELKNISKDEVKNFIFNKNSFLDLEP